MKRTRKWQFIGQEAQRLSGLGMSLSDIGRKLGVRKSTVSRWVSSGKLTRPSVVRVGKSKGAGTVTPTLAPDQWAESVRSDYALDATDEQLVRLGRMALEMANNQAETPTTRMVAAGRYQAIVKQLALGLSDRKAVTTDAEKPERPPVPRPVIVRSGGDPRSLLSAVK